MSVYGDFLSVAPELFEKSYFWSEGNEQQGRHVYFCYIPTSSGLKRHKGAVDLSTSGTIYCRKDASLVGMYFRYENELMKVVRAKSFDRAAGYFVYTVQRVQGDRPDTSKELQVKEPYFA